MHIDFAVYFFGVCMDVRIMRFTSMKLVAFTDKIKAKPTIEMVQNLVVKLYCSDDALSGGPAQKVYKRKLIMDYQSINCNVVDVTIQNQLLSKAD
jgi:hypothetical protein